MADKTMILDRTSAELAQSIAEKLSADNPALNADQLSQQIEAVIEENIKTHPPQILHATEVVKITNKISNELDHSVPMELRAMALKAALQYIYSIEL